MRPEPEPGAGGRALLEVDDLAVHFPAPGGGPLGLSKRRVRALDGVSLRVRAGDTLGIVGESGSGKSTLGRAVLGLLDATAGSVTFDGERLDGSPGDAAGRRGGRETRRAARRALATLRRESAMVFQDPYGSLNPRLTARETIAEVLRVHAGMPRGDVDARTAELLAMVGLPDALGERRPQALSGGQCQRVGLARALAVGASGPRLVVADECVAALDVSIQGQIVNLFMELTEAADLALVFIAHDLAIVRRLCERVAVMYLGRIVEEGPTEAVFADPRHPYTAALVAAIPEIDPDAPPRAAPLAGEPPSPLDPPPGCAFHPRCPHALERCRTGPVPEPRTDGVRAWRCVLDPGTELLPPSP